MTRARVRSCVSCARVKLVSQKPCENRLLLPRAKSARRARCWPPWCALAPSTHFNGSARVAKSLIVVAVAFLLVLDVVEGLRGVGRLDAGLRGEDRRGRYLTARSKFVIDLTACILRRNGGLKLRGVSSLAAPSPGC